LSFVRKRIFKVTKYRDVKGVRSFKIKNNTYSSLLYNHKVIIL